MKYEKLNESNGKSRKMFLYGFLMCAILLIIINMFLTKAKYKVVDSTKLVNSTISYSNADFSLVAINVQQTDEQGQPVDGSYQKQDKIPVEKHLLNEKKSYCTAGSDNIAVWGKDADMALPNAITVEYKKGKLNFGNVTETNTKCYLWFDAIPIGTSDRTLADLGLQVSTDGCPTVDPVSGELTQGLNVERTQALLCKSKDDYGETYYFRGKAENNWVKIGETYWRIIRINGNGTIRLIYNGTTNDKDSIVISSQKYNDIIQDNAYVGFKFGTVGATSYADAHNNANKSRILTVLDECYLQNLSKYESILDGAIGFCNDRTPYNGSSASSKIDTTNYGFSGRGTYYGAYLRNYITYKPIFKCPQVNQDLFTTINEEEIGNQSLEYPIGLITADEVLYAGAHDNQTNQDYYLYSNQSYWTMSPAHFNGTGACVFYVNNVGAVYNGSINGGYTYADYGVRPVINLKAYTQFEQNDGDGSKDKPFTVKLN